MADIKDQVSIGERLTALEECVEELGKLTKVTGLLAMSSSANTKSAFAMLEDIVDEINRNRKRLKRLEKRSHKHD